jgi:ubiquinone/menaquinone biosynthesis C-methylase UbiE
MREGDFSRTQVLDPAMLRLAGEVRGARVCDVGCGEGRFSRFLSERGAKVVGVEPTPSLVGAAQNADPQGCYLRAGGEWLPLMSDTFDLVVSYLVLIDIDDYRKAIAEMTRILKPGGRFLIANLNSFCTTRERAWLRDEEGKLLHVAVDDYFEERGARVSWADIDIINYHRPFQDYMQALLQQGLRLTDFEEPRPSDEAVSRHPREIDGTRVPFFHVMQWQKE